MQTSISIIGGPTDVAGVRRASLPVALGPRRTTRRRPSSGISKGRSPTPSPVWGAGPRPCGCRGEGMGGGRGDQRFATNRTGSILAFSKLCGLADSVFTVMPISPIQAKLKCGIRTNKLQSNEEIQRKAGARRRRAARRCSTSCPRRSPDLTRQPRRGVEDSVNRLAMTSR